MTSADAANSDQIEYWNQQAGKRWVTMQESLDQQLESLGLEAIDRARVSSGERVLDIGCGCGQTTLELARRVGPTGHVRGIDISGPMLARARERGTGVPQIEFTQADAQSCDFDAGTCDLLFSRFGVMFFDDPVAAFANLRRALRADGRLTFLCWRGIEHNPWMRVPIAAVAAEIEFPAPPPPNAPGPFAFADAERVQGILADAGFADVSAEAAPPHQR